MPLKLDPEYTLTLSAGGEVEGKLVDTGGSEYAIQMDWSPKMQNLSPIDGVKVRQAQDALRAISVQLRLLMDLEV